jgi:hypothetical protein
MGLIPSSPWHATQTVLAFCCPKAIRSALLSAAAVAGASAGALASAIIELSATNAISAVTKMRFIFKPLNEFTAKTMILSDPALPENHGFV